MDLDGKNEAPGHALVIFIGTTAKESFPLVVQGVFCTTLLLLSLCMLCD